MSLNKSALLSQTRLEISAGNVAEHVPFKLTSTYVKELRAAIVLLSFFFLKKAYLLLKDVSYTKLFFWYFFSPLFLFGFPQLSLFCS